MASSLNVTRFPRLQSATFQPLTGDGEIEVSYKSGAYFKGQIQGHKKIGRGIFTWPNGASYEGDYADNMRTGSGVQLWSDGSKYEGDFHNDMRHGDGEHTWANEEMYNGQFFQDHRHGRGLYSWPDGSSFRGTFYMDHKEGFGTFTFSNGNTFEGLYKEDEREGPGIQTNTDGTQDVGLWHGEKLVKICSAIPGAFTVKDHKEHDFKPEEHIHYLPIDEKSSLIEELTSMPQIFDGESNLQIADKVKSSDIFNFSLDPRSLAVNKEMFDDAFFQTSECDKENNEKVPAWNKTPSMISIQKHFHKHRRDVKSLSFDVNRIVKGQRTKFKAKGPLELMSEELIKEATAGNVNRVEDLLTSGKVSPDVSDKDGFTPLIGASVNWHMDVINCLLNHGADVNKLSDEGCSALSAGSIFYYPTETFRWNIAERYLPKPKDKKHKSEKKETDTQSSQPKESPQPKSILSKKLGGKKNINTKLEKTENFGSRNSVDAENLLENQIKPSPRQQVRIIENVNNNQEPMPGDEVKGVEADVDLEKQEFDSDLSMKYYEIEVSDQLIERCATQLSLNEKVVGGRRGDDSADLGTVRHLAVLKNEHERMKMTLDLLLRRGADPNASGVPMPVLFFAIKAADVDMVKVLLMKGASTAIKLPKEKGGLAPLHISCAIPGEEGVQITELLLAALADPDVRAEDDDSFLNTNLMDEWNKDTISPASRELLGGRTPLLIACARDDNYKHITRVVRLLLDHKANTSLLCNGFSPLALNIVSGNDMAIDELLLFGADPSLPLTHGVGSALCAATNTEYEHRRTIKGRLHLIDKLVRAGANMLAPIPIGPKRMVGTVVDYSYYIFNQDRRIAGMPYHALSHAERETYNARRKLLAHVGDLLRVKAIEREKRRLEDERVEGTRSASPSSAFVYIGAGAPLPADTKRPKFLRDKQITIEGADGMIVSFEGGQTGVLPEPGEKVKSATSTRKPLFRYCYECGRSVNVRLTACTRCKEVYYCSKVCKLKAWNARHKEECIRLGARSRSPSPSTRRQRSGSPSQATRGKKTTAEELAKEKRSNRLHDGAQVISGDGLTSTGSYLSKQNMLVSDEVPRKDLSHSAKSSKFNEAHMARLEKIKAAMQPGMYIDNYSYV